MRFNRAWRNGHEGCAWCPKGALHFDLDRNGEKVGACRDHVDNLTPLRNERQGKLINEAVARDRRIDRNFKRRKGK